MLGVRQIALPLQPGVSNRSWSTPIHRMFGLAGADVALSACMALIDDPMQTARTTVNNHLDASFISFTNVNLDSRTRGFR
jgi:hypothetical protein